MRSTLLIIAICTAALWLAACAPAGSNGASKANTTANANANANSAKPVAAAPTKDALMALEKSGWQAWKDRDVKWTEDNYTDKGFNLNAAGLTDKATMIKTVPTQKCEIKSFSLSEDKMTMAGPDMAVLTFKGTQDGTCDGKKLPASVWSGSVYVRDGDKWKAAFYAEAPVVDPKAPPAKPPASTKPAPKPATPATAAGPETDALLAIEKKAWEAWKAKDAKALEDFAAKDMVSLVTPEGWVARADAIKKWTTEPCEIKAVNLTEPYSVTFTSDAAILTFKATVDGKCGTESLTPERGATVYVKENGTWKALMTMGIPAA